MSLQIPNQPIFVFLKWDHRFASGISYNGGLGDAWMAVVPILKEQISVRLLLPLP
jgi:hypothetical protein